jgi:hypothetical protein
MCQTGLKAVCESNCSAICLLRKARHNRHCYAIVRFSKQTENYRFIYCLPIIKHGFLYKTGLQNIIIQGGLKMEKYIGISAVVYAIGFFIRKICISSVKPSAMLG